jgi:hypothetical protein
VPGKLRSITKSVACLNPAAVWLGDSPIGMRFSCLASSISIDVLVAPVSKCASIWAVLIVCGSLGDLYTEAVEEMFVSQYYAALVNPYISLYAGAKAEYKKPDTSVLDIIC